MNDCITVKTCSECGETKSLDEFNAHRKNADGRQQRCRSCFSAYNRQRYLSRQDEFREHIYEYREENPDKVLHSRLVTCSKKPTHRNAYRAIEAALTAGAVERPSVCHGCGCSDREHRIEAHHHDYTKPLDIIWLCTPCHSSIHWAIRRRRKVA